MRLLALFSVAAILWPVSGAIDSTTHLNDTVTATPNTYIVALKPGSHLKRGFESPHAEFYHDLTNLGVKWQTTREYDSPIITGSVVRLDHDEDLPKLSEARGVEFVTPVYIYAAPKPVSSHTLSTQNRALRWHTFSPHRMTGVDKLHRLGYYGQGIKIAVIDSGVDYKHPALGGGLGPQYKVIGGYDFVGDEYTGDSSSARPSNDPMDNCNGHGTHVAGIIGANPKNPFGISGAAYMAKINAYRIISCKDYYSDDIFVDALLRAYKDGNDVINLSLRSVSGWSTSMSGVVASRIARAGRAVVVSAGNDGNYGAWYTSAPSDGPNVMSIGSVDNLVTLIEVAVASNGRKILYRNNEPLRIPTGLPLYTTSSNTNAPADACEPLPQGTPDLSNKLVIIRRGTCQFVTKTENASKYGARYFLIYDNADQSLVEISNGPHTLALISQADGRFLVTEGIAKRLTLSFPNKPMITRDPGGGLTSNFTTYGPTYDMLFKPAVSAPGGNILSTWPRAIGTYKIISGTSMATPHVAGAIALYLQIKGKSAENARAAQVAFQNTARPVPKISSRRGMIETAAHQGAGLIQAYDAIRATARMYPAEILLNDTTHFRSRRRVFIRNGGNRGVVYRLSHQPAGTMPTINGIENKPGPLDLVSSPARVWVSAKRVYIPARRTVPVTVWFRPPTQLNPKTFPVYSGYIQARGTDGSVMQSSYMGVAAPMKSMKVLDNTAAFTGAKLPYLSKQGRPVYKPTTYTFQNGDIPRMAFRLVAGTPSVQVHLIDWRTRVWANQRRSQLSDESSPHDVTDSMDKQSLHSPRCPRQSPLPGGTFARVKTVGLLAWRDFPSRDVSGPIDGPRSALRFFEFATFANDSQIPNGNYKLLLRVLKITGDRTREEDYEVWTSPAFAIRKGQS